ncbi:putative c6 zinc finger domain containing protein [Phaeomoniella chlamydospora]|uniref:Putative c6 zinc finger domain containing protein n=1 Tax=Phaeomoniella chlamydospora TaxID=158046 RepID=A0A0G2EG00_PHACM|nr:putative c6 zinc finger domain containing protein [Phaeomoniella chlamydospora]
MFTAGKPPDFSIAAEDSRPPLRSPPAKEPSNQLDITHTASSVHLLGLFYSYFFPAHPFVLPRGHLSDKFNKNECPQLQAVVEYLGACHDPMARKTDYLEMVNRRLFVTPPPQNPYTVQALLLFAIDAHANHEKDRALDMVRRGIRLALDLGMHSSVFATTHGFGDVVIEECWRRTFWELYIIERVLAADSRASESILITRTPIAVPLPCEESEYLTGNIYKHQTFEDFENRAFLGDDITFSSYAYRIDAARILASTLRLAANPPPDETTIEKIDHELGQWCLYLPDTKRTLVSKDGIYDEVLFHAHALTF